MNPIQGFSTLATYWESLQELKKIPSPRCYTQEFGFMVPWWVRGGCGHQHFKISSQMILMCHQG